MPKFDDEIINRPGRRPHWFQEPLPRNGHDLFRLDLSSAYGARPGRRTAEAPAAGDLPAGRLAEAARFYFPWLRYYPRVVLRHVVDKGDGPQATELTRRPELTLAEQGVTGPCVIDAAGDGRMRGYSGNTIYTEIKRHLNGGGRLLRYCALPYRLHAGSGRLPPPKYPGAPPLCGFPKLRSSIGRNLAGPVLEFGQPAAAADPAMACHDIWHWLYQGPFGRYVTGSWVRFGQRDGPGPVNVWVRVRLTNAALDLADPAGRVADIWFLGARVGDAWTTRCGQRQFGALQLNLGFEFDYFRRFLAAVDAAVRNYERGVAGRPAEYWVWPDPESLVGAVLVQDPPRGFHHLWGFMRCAGGGGNSVWSHANKTNTAAGWDAEPAGTRFVWEYAQGADGCA